MPTSILFTGHMIDKPGRQKPRFPAELEAAVVERLAAAIAPYAPGKMAFVQGFASCAQGGDILFHEQCRVASIATTIVLPFPPEVFLKKSVGGVPGSDWERRFWHLWNTTPEEQRETMNLPPSDDAYGACNIRLLARAREYGAVHLIALWDGRHGDGPGGAADLVARAGAADEPDIFSPWSLMTDP
ncbi:hypothetical protein GOA53_29385 [Sinorhizobium meliloti]|uniref:hypothetical protein n=1 Tax=Rhizobium meliloti TaxID=382 RepID=UPI001295845E|nr:hypothetical protein [Sinorhizobium meliloti]MDW9433493.1 hypothetical protein [Sinorhizobium meliloti]MQV77963.1 hypothetical protein [Sinorhizobium meliloti]